MNSLQDFFNFCLSPCLAKNVTIFDKAGLDAHIKQIHFPPPVQRSIHGLTFDGYLTVRENNLAALNAFRDTFKLDISYLQ